MITQAEAKELVVRELRLEKHSPLIGKAAVEAQTLLDHGLTIVALKKLHGLLVSPRRETIIEEGDTIIVVGVPEFS